MKRAHSTGFIEYLSSYTRISQPDTNSTTTEDEFYSRQRKVEREAKRLTDSEIRDKAISLKAIPKHIKVVSTKYYRSPFIVEYAKRKANGVCQDCKNPAPFLNKENGEPFLETHHIIPLADGGEDSVENTIALCPNCHRKRHYG
ncbi:MAG: HNH endonuclease [Ignavibacteriae bacterium]|nr:HNH endonuclease [Ignavibacteriota bacterium]MCB9216793.1 HNH endonuclease [Ignavibacteria bacterium]